MSSDQETRPVYGLTKENFLAALPMAPREAASVAVLAEAAAEFLARPVGEIRRLKLYPEIDRMDKRLLDILAVDFKVDWWDPDFPVEEKRLLLKGCWKVHKLQGTKAGLETAISAVYPNAAIQEWFEYNGEPHHFRVRLGEASYAITEDSMKKFRRALGVMKRLSSHLDEVQADCTGHMTAYHGLHGGQLMEIGGDDIIHADLDHYAALTDGVLLEFWGNDAVPGNMERYSALTMAGQAELWGDDGVPCGMTRCTALGGGTMVEIFTDDGAKGDAER